jgi:hypothetical protein
VSEPSFDPISPDSAFSSRLDRVRVVVAIAVGLAAGGCAQLFDLDETSGPPADAGPPRDVGTDVAPDAARACLGGDARTTDPGTGTCYVLFNTPLSHADASVMCLTLGSDVRLATVESSLENAIIATLVGTATAYLGGTDTGVEGIFAWGTGAALSYTNWQLGEPNNGAGTIEEDCIVIRGDLGGTWDDRPCAPPPIEVGTAPFVCEYR